MKFGNLLKKELRELITKQAIIGMIFTCAILIFMGQIMGAAMEEGLNTTSFTLCNQDNSDFTKDLLASVTADGSTEINYVELQSEDYPAELERLDVKNIVIIPEGYAKSVLEDKKPADIKFVGEVSTGGVLSSVSNISASDVINTIQEHTTNEILLKEYGISDEEIERIKEPTALVEYSVVNGKVAKIPAAGITAITMAQSMIAPFVIFFLLLMASQMIMTAISTEKIDKTLETLLSTPVSRMTVLLTKMTAAVISALMNAAFMMVGFFFYITGMIGNISEIATDSINDTAMISDAVVSVTQAISDLGMVMTPVSFLLFGVQLFFTVAIGLAVSLILGAMATDVKSVQTLTMPIMIAVLIPFFVVLFLDLNAAPVFLKIIMYLIPFTHTYTALTNLMNGDMLIFWIGLVYQIIFFIVCMFLAVRVFTTDKLFTMAFSTDNSGKKKKALSQKKTKSTAE